MKESDRRSGEEREEGIHDKSHASLVRLPRLVCDANELTTACDDYWDRH